ncbi:DNA polymerase I [Candidatus Cardinium hertigii]|uniref:DNA polymerase I n=1 Tax=Candidatus Cardinium hertigii TaxID=247481 RepID=A0A2Z3L7X4_9BACT|nr:DNA polymerase I [Candidatus Cardinium hertigii]AWN81733.1 DNA polymerase I [Candidatus Cardinium hertigii]
MNLFSTPKLFLLDGLSLIYRAYFALAKAAMVTAAGIPTGAIVGFVNTLLEMIQKEKPTHIIVTFDSKEKTFRHRWFPAYKAHRQAQPEAISIAIPYIQQLLTAWGILWMEYNGYEADDLMGSLAKQAAALDCSTYLMSMDKDLAQLVGKNVSLYKPTQHGQKAVILGEKEVLAQWGISKPTQVCDILALEGDPTDAIPGIPSIGRITAQKLIARFETLENLLENTNQLTDKLKTTLEQYADQGKLSKQLATICTDIPVTLDLNSCTYQLPSQTALEPLLTQLELKQFSKRLLGTAWQAGGNASLEAGNNAPPHHYQTIETLSDCQTLVQTLQQANVWAFDIATHASSDPYTAPLLGIAFSYKPGEAYYVPLPTDANDRKPFIQLLQPLLGQTQLLKISHDIKYKLIVLHQHGLALATPFFDTLIAHALLAADGKKQLADLLTRYLHYTPNQPSKASSPAVSAATSGTNAAYLLQLHEKLALALAAEADLFYQVEMPLIPILAAMELAGVAIDVPFLHSLSTQLQDKLKKLQAEIYALAGCSFNIDSPKQLGNVLFEQLALPTNPLKTKKGHYATGEKILEKLTAPIASAIRSYRSLQKLRSTYVEVLPTLLHPLDQRLHTSYQQATVVTGRLSATNPNLQNIPIKTKQGRELRRAFIPHNKGDLLFSADYSQIELRIMAACSQDATMLQAFQQDQDIHQITASKLFKVATTAVDNSMRRKAKTANFGILYGISAFGLAQRMDAISPKEAAQWMETYFAEFPGIKSYIDQTIASAEEKGYVTTLLGRKRFFPDIHSRNAILRNTAKRSVINTVIQGSAAEMIKLAMINIYHWLQSHALRTQMIMQVHDELVFNVPLEEVPSLQQQIPSLMAEALPLAHVPIKVNCHLGPNWLETS